MSTSPHLSPAPAGQVDPKRPLRWWRFGMVWLVVSGPALVVAAGFATLAIAYRHADAVVVEAPAPGTAPLAGATAPALQARNHAVTPPQSGARR
jgi:hypothetical protein